MQKLHHVTISAPDMAPFSTDIMGTKVSAKGITIPLSKADAIDIAWARFFKHYLNIDVEGITEGTSVRTTTGEVYLYNISATTLKQLSAAYRQHLLGQQGYKAVVETTTFVGLSVNAVGKKRDANGKKIRKRDKKQGVESVDKTVETSRVLPNGKAA